MWIPIANKSKRRKESFSTFLEQSSFKATKEFNIEGLRIGINLENKTFVCSVLGNKEYNFADLKRVTVEEKEWLTDKTTMRTIFEWTPSSCSQFKWLRSGIVDLLTVVFDANGCPLENPNIIFIALKTSRSSKEYRKAIQCIEQLPLVLKYFEKAENNSSEDNERLQKEDNSLDNSGDLVFSDDSFIYYCRNCGSVFSGPQELDGDDKLCPNCEAEVELTDISEEKWQSLTKKAKDLQIKIWKNQKETGDSQIEIAESHNAEDSITDKEDNAETKSKSTEVPKDVKTENQIVDNQQEMGTSWNDATLPKIIDDIEVKLQRIKNYYEDGLITKDEYDKKRNELINRI